MEKQKDVVVEIARLIWRLEISIDEFYAALGINLDDVNHSDPTDVVTELAGIFTGWNNQPE